MPMVNNVISFLDKKLFYCKKFRAFFSSLLYNSTMLKSMTGYGRASLVTNRGRFVAEVHSVNRKHLEVQMALPSDFLAFDNELRQLISKHILRGQVTLRLSGYFEQDAATGMIPNLPRIRQITRAWNTIAKDLNITMSSDSLLNLLMNQDDLLLQESALQDNKECLQEILAVVEKALQECVAARKREGMILQQDLMDRLTKLEGWVQSIQQQAPQVVERYRTKLEARLKEMLPGLPENDPSVLREVCLYADRVDIAEEVTRYHSHLQHLKEILLGTAESNGKKLDFLLQELMREISTMGSKMTDQIVSRVVIDSKTELERIREQIQNIE